MGEKGNHLWVTLENPFLTRHLLFNPYARSCGWLWLSLKSKACIIFMAVEKFSWDKMKRGEICIHIIRGLLGLLGAFKAHLILKYLNKKALGMQTIFDLTIKDLIYIYSLTWGSSFLLFALPTILGPNHLLYSRQISVKI